MKKGICLFLCFCMLFAFVPAAGAANALSVDATWTILLPLFAFGLYYKIAEAILRIGLQ